MNSYFQSSDDDMKYIYINMDVGTVTAESNHIGAGESIELKQVGELVQVESWRR